MRCEILSTLILVRNSTRIVCCPLQTVNINKWYTKLVAFFNNMTDSERNLLFLCHPSAQFKGFWSFLPLCNFKSCCYVFFLVFDIGRWGKSCPQDSVQWCHRVTHSHMCSLEFLQRLKNSSEKVLGSSWLTREKTINLWYISGKVFLWRFNIRSIWIKTYIVLQN